MATAVEAVKAAFVKGNAAAEKAYRKMVEAAVDGKSPPENSYEVLERVGKTGNDFEQDVKLLADRRRWDRDIGDDINQPPRTTKSWDSLRAEYDAELAALSQKFQPLLEASRNEDLRVSQSSQRASFAVDMLIETADQKYHDRCDEIAREIGELKIPSLEARLVDCRIELERAQESDPGGAHGTLERAFVDAEKRFNQACKARDELDAERADIRQKMLQP